MSDSAFSLPESRTSSTATGTHITHPGRLRLFRRAWIGTASLLMAVFIIALPNEYVFLRDSARWGMGYQTVLAELGLSRDFLAAFIVSFEIALGIYMAAIASFIFRKRSDDWMALLISLTLIFAVISGPLAVNNMNIEVSASFRTLGIVMFILLIFLFPDGRFVPGWMRWLPPLSLPLLIAFIPYQIDLFMGGSPHNVGFAILLTLLIVAIMMAGFVSQVYRYRNALTPMQRQQTKWVTLGFAVAMTVTLTVVLLQVLFPAIRFPIMFPEDITYSRTSLLALFILIPLFFVGNAVAPLAITLSMIRYGLWNVDVVINRSLVYGVVTMLLALVFGGIIALVSALTQGQGSAIGAIVAAVIATMLFSPTRRRVQHFIDRRIYGLNFDLNELQAAQKSPLVQHPGALSGRQLGDYLLLDAIGKGGMGEVYKAKANGQTVALKILPTDLAKQEHYQKRFAREAHTLTVLHHPNIVQMVGAGTSDGIAYLAMEFLDGQDLGQRLKNGALSLDDARDILRTLAAALDYAHGQGFVHRDIKPSNIMLRQAGDGETWEGVLMDFGIAKIRDSATRLTGTGAIGTIDYMAPEQIISAAEVDHRADIYALGIVAYEMLTGEPPYKGSAAQVMFAHLQQPAPDPREVNDDIPASAAHAVQRAMAKQPHERFATVGEFVAALG